MNYFHANPFFKFPCGEKVEGDKFEMAEDKYIRRTPHKSIKIHVTEISKKSVTSVSKQVKGETFQNLRSISMKRTRTEFFRN